MYDKDDYINENDIAVDCCSDYYYSGNMYSVEEETTNVEEMKTKDMDE